MKRGLGLLVVALIAWLAALLLMQVDATTSTIGGLVVLIAAVIVSLTFIAALIGGLGLLAWGLLRD